MYVWVIRCMGVRMLRSSQHGGSYSAMLQWTFVTLVFAAHNPSQAFCFDLQPGISSRFSEWRIHARPRFGSDFSFSAPVTFLAIWFFAKPSKTFPYVSIVCARTPPATGFVCVTWYVRT
ncbi:hypothetical protein F4804DRAFT_137558 [Jackrogersella minutella]|nr:hypothetical protein F4804DRAFT_137558 [Jackrogersella minutella]